MTYEVFLDTNILIYAIHNPKENLDKQKIAMNILTSKNWVFSTVVLGEFYTVTTRKAKMNLSHESAMNWIDGFLNYPCISIDAEVALKAMNLKNRYNLQYFDSTHIIAAQKLNISTVYSEDMGHNQLYDGVRVINPFI